MNRPKETTAVYAERYKTLIKEIKDNKTDREIFHVLGLDYTAKCNLQIQGYPCQIANGTFQRTRAKKTSQLV